MSDLKHGSIGSVLMSIPVPSRGLAMIGFNEKIRAQGLIKEIKLLILYRLDPTKDDYTKHAVELRNLLKLISLPSDHDTSLRLDNVELALLPLKKEINRYGINILLEKADAIKKRIAHILIERLDSKDARFHQFSMQLYELLCLMQPKYVNLIEGIQPIYYQHDLMSFSELVEHASNAITILENQLEQPIQPQQFQENQKARSLRSQIEHLIVNRLSPDYKEYSKLYNHLRYCLELTYSSSEQDFEAKLFEAEKIIATVDSFLGKYQITRLLNETDRLKREVENSILELPTTPSHFPQISAPLYQLLKLLQTHQYIKPNILEKNLNEAKRIFDTYCYLSPAYVPNFTRQSITKQTNHCYLPFPHPITELFCTQTNRRLPYSKL